jgi:hypothetical protein
MESKAKGSFEVKMTPQTWSDTPADPLLARFLLEKQFHGDLEATSQGMMLTAGAVQKGSAGYVALEKVTGKLSGRSGTFILQHNGTMNRGVPELTITTVPDSGTDELTGISGHLTIEIDKGNHTYTFTYTLATIQ